jgi:ATPase subunit of ABC transporter with duplicated ATPase domains
MLDIKDVTISNKYDNRVIIKDFNFTLNTGDKAVIIGEEGNGKSTLLKFIYSSCLLDAYCEYTGHITGYSKLGYLEQEMDNKWMDSSVEDFLSEADIYSCSNPAIWTMNINPELLVSKQKINTLSGGEKVKVRLLKLLAEEPDILLLDEPTNDLDIGTLKWLEDFINQAQLPILYVSHDETLIENTANVIIHLELIKRKTEPHYTITRSNYQDYMNDRMRGLKKQEMVARKQREDYKNQMQRWQQIYNKVESQQDSISRGNPSGGRLLKKKIKSLKSQEKRIEKQAEDFLDIPDVEELILYRFPQETQIPNGKKVLEYTLTQLKVLNPSKEKALEEKDLIEKTPKEKELSEKARQDNKSEDEYYEEKILAENIFLRVIGPEHIAIIGDNGTGKTTFIRGIEKELSVRGDIKAGYMPQNYEELLDYEMLPADFLAPSGQKEDVTRAFTYMGGMKFTRDEMEHKIGNLSGGQKAKLILLHMILEGCNVLVLDEPTRNLSPLSNPVIRGVLAEYKGTIISVTHDRKYMNEVADTIYELSKSGLIKRYDWNN